MNRISKFATIIIAMSLFGYIVFSFYIFKDMKRVDVCEGLIIVVKDSLEKNFVTEADLTSLLKRDNLYPVEKQMKDINTNEIEESLLKNEMIANIEVYKTPSRKIKLLIEQKRPILRVMGVNGSFYVDEKGTIMPVSNRYVAHVPLASGYIERELSVGDLYHFALFLQRDKFWDAQIDQIYVHPNGDIELTPRVGNHKILLGTFEDYREKLDNLRLFYDKVIPKMGWEKYSIINLKYKNQIVCTKR
jgi:hypothetical protein